MNAERRHNLKSDLCCAFALSLAAFVSGAKGASPREMLNQGNGLYGDGQYTEAINKYNDALVEQPQSVEPRFNKANSYYRLDDLSEAMDLYQEVAAQSKDMNLVAKAKYNLGNAFFQRGAKQRDSDLQKAVEDMKTSITHWRQVLDIDPKNEKAARNIEVARLTIKDILDQIRQQQKDQQNQQDPNQPQQGQQQQQQNQSQSQQDPNQPQDPNQAKDANQSQDPNQTKKDSPTQEPNQPQDQQQQVQDKQEEQKIQPDATAQQIIDNEQRQKKEREIRQRATYQRVEKDW
ncbi:MAG: tetratricopeptide repeat protein [Phycisphaerales bacterium]